MDRFDAMRVFVAVVEQQGFSAAARLLSMPLPTVSRKIAELERHLGAQLLVRSTRSVTVTDSGWRYYEDVRRILDHLGEAERRASGEYRMPKGRLTITAPTLLGRLFMLPVLADFMKSHREIDVQLTLTNAVVDLVEDHVDLGVRVAARLDDAMIARAIGSVRQVVCASPAYFAQRAKPSTPKDLAAHRCVTFPSAGLPAQWHFKMSSGDVRPVPVRSRLTLNSIEGNVEAALLGAGLVQLYSYQAARHVAEGSLEIVLDEYEIDPTPVSVVYPQSRRIPLKVRAFFDFALPRLRERLALVETQCSAGQIRSAEQPL